MKLHTVGGSGLEIDGGCRSACCGGKEEIGGVNGANGNTILSSRL